MKFALLFVALCWAAVGLAQDIPYDPSGFTLREVADHQYKNREPVISETGLVAWLGHGAGFLDEQGGGSEIFVYRGGATQMITEDGFHERAAHQRPQVSGDTVVWQTTRDRYEEGRKPHTWVLREVPDHLRDVPFEEKTAFYVNANRIIAEGRVEEGGDFNLNPWAQTYVGPFTNYAAYVEIYELPDAEKITNVFGQVENYDADDEDDEFTEEDILKLLREGDVYDDLHPSQLNARRRTLTFGELCRWTPKDGIEQLTFDTRNDLGPSLSGEVVAWQKAKSFPFGWEIMALDGESRYQLSTNFYYDMGAQVHDRDVVWYGWDGSDYEIFHWNADTRTQKKITDNDFDDVSPRVHNGIIAWEAFEGIEPHIYLWQTNSITQLSYNIEADRSPRVWNGAVVWEGLDADGDFEIYYYNPEVNKEVIELTDNRYDDVEPEIRDGLIVWLSYHDGFDAEVVVYNMETQETRRITDNEVEDHSVYTAGGKVVWGSNNFEQSEIWVATP